MKKSYDFENAEKLNQFLENVDYFRSTQNVFEKQMVVSTEGDTLTVEIDEEFFIKHPEFCEGKSYKERLEESEWQAYVIDHFTHCMFTGERTNFAI